MPLRDKTDDDNTCVVVHAKYNGAIKRVGQGGSDDVSFV